MRGIGLVAPKVGALRVHGRYWFFDINFRCRAAWQYRLVSRLWGLCWRQCKAEAA